MNELHRPPGANRASAPAIPSPPDHQPRSVLVRYLVVGLILGGLWAYQHGAPLWDHAVRMLILLLIVPPMLHRRRTRRRRRLGLEGEPHLSLMRLSVVKVSIVAAALLAAWLLRGRVAGADFWIAGGLTVTVAIVGPLMHRWLIVGGSHATSPRHASRK